MQYDSTCTFSLDREVRALPPIRSCDIAPSRCNRADGAADAPTGIGPTVARLRRRATAGARERSDHAGAWRVVGVRCVGRPVPGERRKRQREAEQCAPGTGQGREATPGKGGGRRGSGARLSALCSPVSLPGDVSPGSAREGEAESLTSLVALPAPCGEGHERGRERGAPRGCAAPDCGARQARTRRPRRVLSFGLARMRRKLRFK